MPYSGLGTVPLIAAEPDTSDAFQLACAASAEAAIRPLVEERLLRPSSQGRSTKSAQPSAESSDSLDFDIEPSGGVTTTKGSLYIANQMSRARDLMRQKMYIQALNCYKAVRTIDGKNTNSLIGMIYCYILNSRYQVGGLAILQLAADVPDFWLRKPDFNAIFGLPASEVAQRILEVEPQIDRIIAVYRPEDQKQLAEDMKLAYLSKMYIAWLKDDQNAVNDNVTLAAKIVPLDAPVQQLYHRVSGKTEKKGIALTPLKPLE